MDEFVKENEPAAESEPAARAPLFENVSEIGKDDLAAFRKYAVKRQSGKIQLVGTAAFALLAAMFFFIENYVLGGVMAAMAMVYVFLPLLLGKISSGRKNTPDILLQGMKETFRFYGDRMESEIESGGRPAGNNVLYYTEIREACADKEHIYLFISKAQAHIVRADGFAAGSAPEFLNFLEEKGVKVRYK